MGLGILQYKFPTKSYKVYLFAIIPIGKIGKYYDKNDARKQLRFFWRWIVRLQEAADEE